MRDDSGSFFSPAAEQLGHDRWVEHRAAFGDTPHGRGEVIEVGNTILEEIAHTTRDRREQPHRKAGLDVLRQDEHAGSREAVPDLGRGAETLVRMRRRHPYVDDRDGRLVHGYESEEVVRVPRLRDDIESRVGQQTSDPLPQQDRVVGEHHADARSKHGDGVPQGREVAWEVVGEQLVDALRPREPLEPMLSEVAALDSLEGAEQIVRNDDLPSVTGVGDA